MADMGLITADVLYRQELLEDHRFAVTAERGFGELFQYVKAAALGVGLIVLARNRRNCAALLWSIVFFWILVDDAFAIHEWTGLQIGSRFVMPVVTPLRPEHVGEALFLGAVAILIATGGVFAWCRRPSCERRTLLIGAAALCPLAFFGGVMDVLHSLARHHWLNDAMAVLEDGGEMIALTGFAIVMAVTHRERRAHVRNAEQRRGSGVPTAGA